MIHKPVYMDYHATTPVDKRVLDAMLPYFTERFGNPASRQYSIGWIAEEGVEQARGAIAKTIAAASKEIVFTSSSTESNNLAIKGVAEAWRQKGNHIITLQTEHKSVLDVCKRLEKSGFQVTYLPVKEDGMLDLQRLYDAITSETILVSILYANNEIGTIQPISEIGKMCKEKGVFFHTDATQAIGYLPIDVQASNIDLMSFNAHKIYGPKGVGALFVRQSNPKVKISMQMDGGGHERGMRSGTLNVPGIIGLAKALQVASELRELEVKRLSKLRDEMYKSFCSELEDVFLNGSMANRLPHNLNMSFLHVDSTTLMMSLKDIALSNGSACSTADPEPSHVLKALRLHSDRLHSAIRFGLGRFTTEDEAKYVITRVIEEVTKLRKLSPYYQKELEYAH
ncbi:MAG: IscS subfamily cysteine desulfurase [Bacteroidetes bacterium]|nr:MAG: IscS subfamily cysteine desulfurase [Bacteroidota bacterium]